MGRGWSRRLGALVSSLALVLAGVGAFAVLPAAASAGSGGDVVASGTTSMAGGGTSSFDLPAGSELASGPGDPGSGPAVSPPLPVDRSQTNGRPGHASPAGESRRENLNPTLVKSFDGLNHHAQHFVNGGTFEPPDQGLCAGNGFVMETLNGVMAVYDASAGTMDGSPMTLNHFLQYPPVIAFTAQGQPLFGPQVSDPSCYYDGATHRWFFVAATADVVASDAFAGAPTGANHLAIAVSSTSSPLGSWILYRVPIQDDGTEGTPDHHCAAGNPAATFRTNPRACVGDYPHIGADANGFYVTTNEYSFFGPGFKGAQVYAFSKRQLAANATPLHVTRIDTGDPKQVQGVQPGFTVWPAESPNGQDSPPGDLDTARGGTEFFLSSNAADEVNPRLDRTSTDLVVWALTGTRSLDSAHPDLTLTNTVLTVGSYAVPPPASQKVGPTPLADCLSDTTALTPLGLGCWHLTSLSQPAPRQVESMSIDTNDTRMQQVMFAGGMIFGALDTGLLINGTPRAGVEWFEVRPHVTANGLKAQLVNQGYVGAANANLSYPALAVNEKGVGAMAFTLLGPDDYPSAAYVPFDARSGTGDIHVAHAGLGPDDGATAYAAAFGGPPDTRARWGDYGAAVVDGSHIWMASEYIGQTCSFAEFTVPFGGPNGFGTCGGTRSLGANWGTRITELAVGG